MKLNMGSSDVKGRYLDSEWINLDLRAMHKVQVRGSITSLPFRANSFDEVVCSHVLEHVTRDKQSTVVGGIWRVLAPDGVAFIEVPDFERVVALLHSAYARKDQARVHIWRTNLYGKSEVKGQAHHFGFDEVTLRVLLESEGFVGITRLTEDSEMLSGHYRKGPIILMRMRKP